MKITKMMKVGEVFEVITEGGRKHEMIRYTRWNDSELTTGVWDIISETFGVDLKKSEKELETEYKKI